MRLLKSMLAVVFLLVGTAYSQTEDVKISMHDFSQEVLAELHKQNPENTYEYDKDDKSISATSSDGENVGFVNLENIYNVAKFQATDERREYLSSILAALSADDTEAFQADRLMPRLRTRSEINLRQWYLSQLSNKDYSTAIAKDFGDIWVELVEDLPAAVSLVEAEKLQENDLTVENAISIATENLALTEQSWFNITPGLWVSDVEDDYDCARAVILEDWPKTFKDGEFVAFFPSHSVCLMTDRLNPEMIEQMVVLGYELSENQRPLSNDLWAKQGGRWQTWLPDQTHPAFKEADMQALQSTLIEHDEQQKVLLQSFEKHGKDVWVSELTAFQSDTGDLTTLVILTATVDTWIGKADIVVYSLLDEQLTEVSKTADLEWADVEVVFKELNIQPVAGVYPVRYELVGETRERFGTLVKLLYFDKFK